MKSCPVRVLALAAGLAAVTAGPLSAQPSPPAAGQPLSLVPSLQAPALQALPLQATEPQADQSGPAPAEALPPSAPASPPAASAPARPKGPRAVSGVDVQELKAPDPNAVGVLDERQGGFGAEMWDGTAAATVRRMMPHLPAATTSRAMRALMRRLLLSGGSVPQDGPGPSLLQLRAERLFAMGDLDGLVALLKAAPQAAITPAIQRLRLDALLLAGDAQAACAELPGLLAGGADPYLAKVQVFCHFAAGRSLEGNMALDLMRERKEPDHAFLAAAEAMGGLPPLAVDKLPNPTPLHLAAFKAAKMALPADAADTAQPALLRAVASAAGLPADARLAAAEKAEAVGAIDTEALRQLYSAVTFSPAELDAPLAQGAGDKGVRTRALLFRAAQQQAQPGPRAEIIARALKLAGERGYYTASARLYAPLIADLRPDQALAAFSPVAAKALYAVGKPEAAARWLAIARANPDTARAAAELWPLVRLYDPEEEKPTPPAVIAAWRAARGGPPDLAERRGAIGLGLVAAVGERVPAAEWLALLDGPLTAPAASPRPALKAMLRAAVDSLQLGETVLLSLVSLGENLDKADPDTIARAVASLRLIGLDKEARELAVEAALANGL